MAFVMMMIFTNDTIEELVKNIRDHIGVSEETDVSGIVMQIPGETKMVISAAKLGSNPPDPTGGVGSVSAPVTETAMLSYPATTCVKSEEAINSTTTGGLSLAELTQILQVRSK